MGLKIGKGGQGIRKPTWSCGPNELSKRILEKAQGGNTSCDPHGNVNTFARLKSGRYTASDLEIPVAVQPEPACTEQAAESFAQTAAENYPQTSTEQYASETCSENDAQNAICLPQNDDLRSMFSDGASEPAAVEEAPAETKPKRKTRDQKKSAIFNAPTSGAMKSKRGTVEVVFREGGKTLIPKYNVARVLQSVTSSDGRVFKRNADGLTWSMFDAYGKEIDSPKIKLAAFDHDGNFYYVTADGIKTTLKVDGSEVSEPIH